MLFTKTFFDDGRNVYIFEKIDKLPQTKENALLHHIAMDCRSWTFERMTQKEKETYINSLFWAADHGLIFGTFSHRWKIMQAIYSAYLDGLGYDGPNWREAV